MAPDPGAQGWTSLAGLVLVALAAVAAVVMYARRAAVRRGLSVFFTRPGGPFNLAVTRICFFAAVAITLPDRAAVQSFAHLPRALIFAPSGLGRRLADLPLNQTWIGATHTALVLACVLGLLGIMPRLCAATVPVAGFYYLGIPQLYGSIIHYHHLLWIGVILAFSPSADALSVPAVWRALRTPGRSIAAPERSLAYTLPLRFIWLLLGVLYLSAGIAKYRFDGLGWLEPATLRNWLHLFWYQGNYRPPFGFRPDEYPILLVLGAAFTLCFETTFWFWVLFDRARPFLAAAGLLFHNSTGLLMRISFFNLQLLYPSLIDWDALSEHLCARRPLMTVRDGEAASAPRRAAAALLPSGAVRHLPGGEPSPPPPARRPEVARSLVAGAAVVLTLLLATTAWGVTTLAHSDGAVAGWPIAAYPSFAGRPPENDQVISLQAQRLGGPWETLSLPREVPFLAGSRLSGLAKTILAAPRPIQRTALRALLAYLRDHDDSLSRYARERVIAAVVDVEPRHLGRRLATRVVLEN